MNNVRGGGNAFNKRAMTHYNTQTQSPMFVPNGGAHSAHSAQPPPNQIRDACNINRNGDHTRINPATLAIEEAERILSSSDQHIIVWKVQYGDEWHEYNTQLAALTEQLQVGTKTTITLSDSDYLLTKIDEKQALQQNLTTGTTRKVVRLFRSKR